MNLLPWMQQWNMLPDPGGTILCAVSGGRDSVCLLHYLHTLGEKQGFTVAAGHYNHHMRPTAQRDEDFVRALCQKLGVAFYTDGSDVEATARKRGLGVEETGRELRYAFLAQTADRIGAQRIATAHHQNDQAETVLLHLLRGTGPEGLRGIPPVRGRLIRPLLDTPREEIEAYLAAHGLPYVEDETNTSTAFARNRLRLKVLPQLKKINPAFARNIARTAAIVGREDRYLDQLAQERLPAAGENLTCAALAAAPEALRPRMIRLLLDRLGVGKKDFSAVHIGAVLEMMEAGRGMVQLPGGVTAVCRNKQLSFQRTEVLPPPMVLQEGENRWGPWHITVRRGISHSDVEKLTLRCRWPEQSLQADVCRGSERLELPGSRGGRSVKRLLSERGVSPEERRCALAIRVDGALAAVAGLGTDQKWTPSPQDDDDVIEIIAYQYN